MSTRSARTAVIRGVRSAAVALLVALLAACGAMTPTRTAGVTPAAAERGAERSGASQANASASARGGERRGGRRDDGADDAAAPTQDSIPEPVLQAHARALNAMRSEDWIAAEIELTRLVLEHPSYPGPYVNLAIVYMQDDRTADAQTMLDKALAIDAGHAAANNQLGIVLRNAGKFSEAETAYRRALATQPGHALAHYNLGVLLDLYLHRQAEALEHYEQYQQSLSEPDAAVGRWIIDLRRRLGVAENASRVAVEGRE